MSESEDWNKNREKNSVRSKLSEKGVRYNYQVNWLNAREDNALALPASGDNRQDSADFIKCKRHAVERRRLFKEE